MGAFYRRWLSTAFWHSFGVADAVSGALGVLGGLVVHSAPARSAEITDLLWQVPLGVFAALFVFRVFAAPYWMHKADASHAAIDQAAAAQRITELLAALDVRARNQETKNLLARHYEYGVHKLFTRKITNDMELDAFEAEVNQWHRNCAEEIEARLDRAARVYFEIAGGVSRVSWTHAYDGRHNTILTQLNIYNERLRDIVAGKFDPR